MEETKRRKFKPRKLNWRDKLLADKIRWFRRDHNLTQEKLSELLHTNLTYLSSVERYKRGVSLPVLYKLSRIFKVKVKDLFEF